MRVEYFSSAICLIAFVWLVPRIGFIKRSGLTAKETRVLLVFKMFTGIVFAGYFLHVFEHISTKIDYIGYNEKGLEQYRLLITNPGHFFHDFSSDLQQYGTDGFFASKDSFWAYLRFNLMYKCIAVLNFITQGDFYLNSALFSALVFFAHIAFFRIYYAIYKTHKYKILLACFCLPSLMLYTACIHKDGIVFLCLGVICYAFYRLLSGVAFVKMTHIVVGMLGMAGIFFFRNYVIIALLPAMLTAIICKRTNWKTRYVLSGCYLAFIILFFMTSLTNSSLNLPAAVVQRKADFALLAGGNTTIPMNSLQPDLVSFVKNVPQAINHVLLRPYPCEFKQLSVLLAALELLFYQLLVLLLILAPVRSGRHTHPFNLFSLAFLINMLLIIGYIIPNIGAIVRYRSIFWILLICPVFCNIDWTGIPFCRSAKRV